MTTLHPKVETLMEVTRTFVNLPTNSDIENIRQKLSNVSWQDWYIWKGVHVKEIKHFVKSGGITPSSIGNPELYPLIYFAAYQYCCDGISQLAAVLQSDLMNSKEPFELALLAGEISLEIANWEELVPDWPYDNDSPFSKQ